MRKKRLKLLLFDSDPAGRSRVRVLLERAPGRMWDFCEADTFDSACAFLQREDIDCILVKGQLPGMRGLEFLGELTKRFGLLAFPVVLFTASEHESAAVAALKAGAQDYLPCDLIRTDTLVRAIDGVIERLEMLRDRDRQQQELDHLSARLETMHAAVSASRDSIMITDAALDHPGPKITFVNPEFTAITGYTAAEAEGKTPRILQGPKTDRAVLDRMRLDLEQGRPFAGRAVNYRKNGSEFVLEWTISSVNDSKTGKLTNYISVQRDATLDTLLETALRETERHMEAALQGSEAGLWEWHCATGRVLFDKQWLASLGYGAERRDTTFDWWASLIHPEDLPDVVRNLEEHISGSAPAYRAQFRMCAKNGQWRWIFSRGRVIEHKPDGSAARVAGVNLDLYGPVR